ncbi:MAG: hypothetical protein SFW09_02855 [Hyphomicrobiaceae bacterium]|nr:hypothetical protein [Hyphomicrobiaceae bacterium]
MKKRLRHQVLVQGAAAGRRPCSIGHLSATASAVLASAVPAEAHEVLGFTGFASLVVHPLVEIELLLCLLALALVVGAGGRIALGPVVLAAATFGTAVGVALQPSAMLVPGLWRLPLMVAVMLGALVAAGCRSGSGTAVVAALAAGTMVGLGLVRERPGLIGALEVTAGAVIAIGAVVLALGLPLALLRRRHGTLAMQIAAAWIVAIGLLGLVAPR